MSITSKVISAALALSVIGGVGAAGTLTANAATPKCGASCVDLFSAAYGTAAHPGEVPGVLNQVAQTGQPIVLAKAADTNPGEDFATDAEGPVTAFVQAGLIASALGNL